MAIIDISMFDTDRLKLILFYMLINRSTSQTNFITRDADITQYELALQCIKKGYIDRFNGRVFKSNINGTTFDTGLYNRDNGIGAAERIVDYIKKELNLTAQAEAVEQADLAAQAQAEAVEQAPAAQAPAAQQAIAAEDL